MYFEYPFRNSEVLKPGCILGMVLPLFAIAPVFSEESYMNTQQVVLTTKEGKTKDITPESVNLVTNCFPNIA